MPMPFDLRGKRLLIFVVAYNAEQTLEEVLERIPEELRQPGVEVLVIDDSSTDRTFEAGRRFRKEGLAVTLLRTPENQGYGGNQKLGYRYAIDHGFDTVALIHGDGQYAPEKLPELLPPLLADEADAVFGSRMLYKRDALRGGMPLYKWLGNQALTRFQNALLGTRLSEFHSGYRLYSVAALRRVPFERNANGFSFDTEIIVQIVLAGMRIAERPIPTFYGDEVCRVDGLRYAWEVARTMVAARVHGLGIFYDRRFDLGETPPAAESPKLGYPSAHTLTLEAARPGAHVLVWGAAGGALMGPLARKGVRAEARDGEEVPADLSAFEQIFLLDAVEHFADPEGFVEALRAAVSRSRPEIFVTTPNVAFFPTRAMLALGGFHYGQRGILDRRHRRLFTLQSLRTLLRQGGYEILETRGLPAPFPKALGENGLARALVRLNAALIRVLPGLFAYEIVVRAKVQPTVAALLEETTETSARLLEQ